MKLILLILCSLLAVIFLVTGIKFFIEAYRFKKDGIRTYGTVIEIKHALGKNNVKTQSPVLSFTSENGEVYTYDPTSFFPTTYKIGQKVPVIYPKKYPSKVKVDSFRMIFMPPLLLIILGFVGIAVSWWLYQKK